MIATSSAATLNHLSITSNTIYQNQNATLYIYSITNSSTQTWIGPQSTNITLIDNSITQYSDTSTLIVPPKWYYKINYTTNTIFLGETIPSSQSSTQLILYPAIPNNNGTSTIAAILFIIGIFFLLIGYIPYFRKKILLLILFRLLTALLFFTSLSIIALTSNAISTSSFKQGSSTYTINQTSTSLTQTPELTLLFWMNLALVFFVIGISTIEFVSFVGYFK